MEFIGRLKGKQASQFVSSHKDSNNWAHSYLSPLVKKNVPNDKRALRIQSPNSPNDKWGKCPFLKLLCPKLKRQFQMRERTSERRKKKQWGERERERERRRNSDGCCERQQCQLARGSSEWQVINGYKVQSQVARCQRRGKEGSLQKTTPRWRKMWTFSGLEISLFKIPRSTIISFFFSFISLLLMTQSLIDLNLVFRI